MREKTKTEQVEEKATAPVIEVTNAVELKLQSYDNSHGMYTYYHQNAKLGDLERLTEEARYLLGDEADVASVAIHDKGIRISRTVGLPLAEEE